MVDPAQEKQYDRRHSQCCQTSDAKSIASTALDQWEGQASEYAGTQQVTQRTERFTNPQPGPYVNLVNQFRCQAFNSFTARSRFEAVHFTHRRDPVGLNRF